MLVRSRVRRCGDDLEVRLASRTSVVRRVDRVWVAGAGKAALAMARGLTAVAPEVAGVVIAPRGSGELDRDGLPPRIRVLAGEHPVPGPRSFAATRRLLAALGETPKGTTVLFLLSGGASALLAAPAEGITAADKTALNRHILTCGAPIEVMNAIRKHVSAVKGGGLLRLARPREIVTLALSDVPGDDLATIGSGPTVADPTSFADALAALESSAATHDAVPPRVWRRLEDGAGRGEPGRRRPAETLAPGDPLLRRSLAAVIGSNRSALDAAGREARRRGYRVIRTRHGLRGEAAEAARDLVGRLPAPATEPQCVLAGGETVVTVGEARGRGGRSQEAALAAAEPLAGSAWMLLVAGTDGIDGETDAAGAFCNGRTLARAGRRHTREALARHDSYGYFVILGDSFRPGRTGTNVMDLAIALHPGLDAQRVTGA